MSTGRPPELFKGVSNTSSPKRNFTFCKTSNQRIKAILKKKWLK